ncbi:MAG: AraC family transcriptional regulator [Hyphomicrobiales bacterium]|nr:AraC family transcriptional regulator [Hyphomicrobiales bacterium]
MLDRLRARSPVMRVVSLPRGRRRLHVMPINAGCETREGGRYAWDGMKRGRKPFALLQHTISGAGWLRHGGARHRLQAGDAFLVTVPHDHRYWVEEGGRWEFFWIAVNGQEALRIARAVVAENGPVLRLGEASVEKLAASCLRIVEGDDDAPGAASAIAYEALMALVDGVERAGAPATGRQGALGRAVERFRLRGGGRTSVAELAAVAGMTRAHFSRRFAERMGASPARFMREERLARAAGALLDDPGATIKRIAAAAGFADANHFAKAFRKAYGESPSERRRRAFPDGG